MNYKLSYFSFAIMLFILFYGCGSSLKVPTIVDAKSSGISIDTLLKGRELYINNCGACHNLYLPNKHTDREWEETMKSMQKKAKITDSQASIILKYLSTYSNKIKK